MSTPKPHRLLMAGVGALTAGALIAGCSSSSKTAATGGTTGNSTSSSTDSSTASAVTSAPAATASAEATKSFASGSGKGSKFCSELGMIAAQQARLAPSGDTPADTKKAFDEIKSLKGALVGSAPASIKGDLTTMFDYILQLDGVLSKADYDWTKINPTEMATFEADAQKFGTAAQNVDNYITQACGIDTGGGSGASPSN